MPRQGRERALILALRFVAAAAETGDGACFDAAFAEAEAGFGPRDGALVVARAAALLRSAGREGVDLALLPPACRALSRDETGLLAALRDRDGAPGAEHGLGRLCEAVADLAAALVRSEPRPLETVDWTGSELRASQFPAVLS